MNGLLVLGAVLCTIGFGLRSAWLVVVVLKKGPVVRAVVVLLGLLIVSGLVGLAGAHASYTPSSKVRIYCVPLPCAVLKSEGDSWTDFAVPFPDVVRVVDVLLGASVVWIAGGWLVRRSVSRSDRGGPGVAEVHNRDAPQ